MVLVLGGSSVVLVKLVVLDCAGYSDDAGAGWVGLSGDAALARRKRCWCWAELV